MLTERSHSKWIEKESNKMTWCSVVVLTTNKYNNKYLQSSFCFIWMELNTFESYCTACGLHCIPLCIINGNLTQCYFQIFIFFIGQALIFINHSHNKLNRSRSWRLIVLPDCAWHAIKSILISFFVSKDQIICTIYICLCGKTFFLYE